MTTFLIVTGMILWCLLTLALLLGGLIYAGGYATNARVGWAAAVAGVVLAAMSGTGVVMTIAGNGWFDGGPPPDGCYQVSSRTDYMPMVAGKVVTVIPYENTNWYPIECPGGGR